MPNSVVVGAQWGDEGKAKVIDYLTDKSDVIIRYQGGANAGHTVIADGRKFVFHLVPSGIIFPGKICVIGNGVVLDPEEFLKELDELNGKGIDHTGRLFISDTAHLVLPLHRLLDAAQESSAKSGGKIGTTGRGIGPAYSDKINRCGLRVGDLRNWDYFASRVTEAFAAKKRMVEEICGCSFDLTLDDLLKRMKIARDRLLPIIADTNDLVHSELAKGSNLLFEGAQGTFLDVDHGTYPFVTSSSTIAGGACTGSGVGPSAIDHVIGIVKVYTTRVGNGPFPTELNDATGERLRSVGGEFGATTGRPRRCGWFDGVLLKKAVRLNGFTRLALTKLDVFSGFEEIKVCTSYEIDGKLVDVMPSYTTDIEKAKPVYETLKGWTEDITACRRFEDLPANAIAFVKRVQQLCCDVPILIVSVGPDRVQTMEVTPL